MKNVKILISCHKKCEIPNNDCFLPIHVGKALSTIDLGFQGDNTGDNISIKNKQYSELTAVYWAWKNLVPVDYIGLCHYRRFFEIDYSVESIVKMINGVDVILVNPEIRPFSNAILLERLVSKEDFYIFLTSILRLYPEYRETVINYYFNSNKWHRFNMFICKWDLFDEYAKFMFNVLMEAEKHMRPSGYSRINRGIGYMGESLWAVFCIQNRLKIKYVKAKNLDYPSRTDIIAKVSRWQFNLRKNLSFYFSRGRTFKKILMAKAVLTGLKNDGLAPEIIALLGDENLVMDSDF